MDIRDILARCDHTLLRVDATGDEIIELCDQGMKYGVASVCIPPCHVAGAKRYVGDAMKICTVIGFPNGYSTSETKVFEIQDAIRRGADEVDVVINLCMLRDRSWANIARELAAARRAAADRVLKVIIETCMLSDEGKIAMCAMVSESGADYIKTSTGFSAGGATREDVALLREHCARELKIKASGGISTLEDAEAFISLGADRLGTSRIVKLVMEREMADSEQDTEGREETPGYFTED